eukprot:gene372-1760_t
MDAPGEMTSDAPYQFGKMGPTSSFVPRKSRHVLTQVPRKMGPAPQHFPDLRVSIFQQEPLMKGYREQHIPSLRKQWQGLICVGAFFAVNVGFNNVSLLTISLSLNQVIRASIPVAAALGSVFIENKRPSRKEFLSLLVLVSGVSIAVGEGFGNDTDSKGIILCIIGTISNGLMMCTIGKIMSEKMSALRLAFYTAPVTCLVLAPFFYALESADFRAYQDSATTNLYIGLLFLGCVNALAYNLVHSMVIKVTSSVTTTVVGEMKIVLILILSAILLAEDDIWTLKMLVGCTIAILGFCMYSHCRMAAVQAQAIPVVKGVPELSAAGSSESPRAPLLSSTSR